MTCRVRPAAWTGRRWSQAAGDASVRHGRCRGQTTGLTDHRTSSHRRHDRRRSACVAQRNDQSLALPIADCICTVNKKMSFQHKKVTMSVTYVKSFVPNFARLLSRQLDKMCWFVHVLDIRQVDGNANFRNEFCCRPLTVSGTRNNAKSFPSHKATGLIFVSLALSQTPVYTARPRYSCIVQCAFAGTHCAYPRRDGQAKLTWVAAYIARLFTHLPTITYPGTQPQQISTRRHSSQSVYLRSLLNYHTPTRSLRSANTNLLSVPRVRTTSVSRGFSIAAPTVWNSLPSSIRSSTSADTFRRLLKTHCFQQAYCSP